MRRAAVLALAAAASAAGAEPQGVGAAPQPLVVAAEDGVLSARLTLAPARLAVGEPVPLTLEATLADAAPGDDRVLRLPDVAQLLREALGEDRAEVEGLRTSADGRSVTGTLRLYDAGSFDLPPLTVELRRPGAGTDVLASVTLDAAPLEIPSALAEDAAPLPTRDALAYEPRIAAPLPLWAVVAGGALLLLAGTLLLAHRRRRHARAAPPRPSVPPHERALLALSDLESRRLPERGAVDPFFTELSEILRRYLEDRFGLRAPEQTTEEFLAEVTGTDAGRRLVSAAQREILRGFLGEADLVKFAREEPGVAACSAAAGTARRFVEETAPRAVAALGEPAA